MILYSVTVHFHEGHTQLLGIFSSIERAKEAGRLFALKFDRLTPIWVSQFTEGPMMEDFQWADLALHDLEITPHDLDESQFVLPDLKKMKYSDYLQTYHWHEVRVAALDRAKYRCQVCNRKDLTLNVHHRTYERRGEELPEDVIVLCRECHELFHKNGKVQR